MSSSEDTPTRFCSFPPAQERIRPSWVKDEIGSSMNNEASRTSEIETNHKAVKMIDVAQFEPYSCNTPELNGYATVLQAQSRHAPMERPSGQSRQAKAWIISSF